VERKRGTAKNRNELRKRTIGLTGREGGLFSLERRWPRPD
jgi:hypothetical protein